MSNKFPSRRRFLQGTAGVGAIGLAGCTGDDGDDDGGNGGGGGGGDDDGGSGDDGGDGDDVVNMRVGSSTQGSTVFQTSQAVQRVLREQSDTVRWDTQTTGGDPASIRIYNEGDLEAYGLTNFTQRQALNSEGPFDGEELDTPYQGFTYFVRDDFFWAVDGSGIETTDDMLGESFHMLQPGWGTREMFEEIMITGGGEDLLEQLRENVVNVDVGDVAGAVEEGNITCGIGYGANEVNLPSWFAEVDARSDIHLVEVTDQFREVFEESPLAPYFEKEPYGFTQDVGDTLQGWQLLFQYFFSPDVSADAVYEVLQIAHDHYESVQEGQPAFLPYGENPEHFVTAMEPDFIPVHPGAADFYEDNDLWDDSWDRGE
ncbi:TRAP transporter substrate-binding protein [Halorubrum sp. JWXQ-INN 858]|uniref:TAXI family TRAP transporter solute-binding subunit n=1 Tax=Halorubrum sp. JWXQ-INN 858 TaxID=2690782 RepID=UPI0013567D7E|nr:TAXI family TRAP transporter solute-binding subunit [Halorubrum sp. JWXQ-INN 858]MWV65595.1 TRAP transporter substrate-binding protein [Halorubrum sp. JWXQ-INN 858]